MNSRSGQAMVEFLLGLVGIMVVVLGLHLVAGIVDADFDSIYNTRETVSEMLSGQKAPTSSLDGSVYAGSARIYTMLEGNINYSGVSGYLAGFAVEKRGDSLSFLSDGSNPLPDLTASASRENSILISSAWLRKILGTSRLSFGNAVAMPRMDEDLMN